MNAQRMKQADFWCKRNLNRSLADVVQAVRVLMRREETSLVRQTLREAFPGMPLETIIAIVHELDPAYHVDEIRKSIIAKIK